MVEHRKERLCGLEKTKYGDNFRRADRVFGPRFDVRSVGPRTFYQRQKHPSDGQNPSSLRRIACVCLHSAQASSPISWRAAKPRSSEVRLRDCPGGYPGVLARLGQSHLHNPVRLFGCGRNSSSLRALFTGRCSCIPCSTTITTMHL